MSLSQTHGYRPTTLTAEQSRDNNHNLNLKGHSHFDLFINGCREVELGEGLPFFRCADAVIRQLFHRHSVNAFRVPDPVVHLQRHIEQELVFKMSREETEHSSAIKYLEKYLISLLNSLSITVGISKRVRQS